MRREQDRRTHLLRPDDGRARLVPLWRRPSVLAWCSLVLGALIALAILAG